ncbi:hypothetical protein L5515_006032 [Caenorhabditis briggsae]|uniref:T20D4.11-like domain-containing protein n=1 Tax=Caenorhabditis briggsae TaxID=6238 RepID=A0AAE9EYE2_CAEBR|nr:hypothetical protein L5515_006032 [Caenorhabditis briggsae]
MSNFYQLSITLIFLTIATNGTNQLPGCSPKVLAPQVSKCMKILKHLVELVSSTPDYKKIGNDVIKDCNAFRECSTIVKCVNNASFENIIEMLYNNCDAAEYFIKDFPKCDDKLEGLNSTCLEEWNPFKDTPINETFVELPDEQKVICEDYYGKDDCVKKHIVETCGEKEFEIFHKHQKNVVKIVGDCRLE